MQLSMLKSKIHRATVTHADVDYEGSVTIDTRLMNLANILPHESVHIWNVTRGTRVVTYALAGPADSGFICVNGAAAHLNQPGDVVILATFANLDAQEAAKHEPVVVRVDAGNRPVCAGQPEQPAPELYAGLESA